MLHVLSEACGYEGDPSPPPIGRSCSRDLPGLRSPHLSSSSTSSFLSAKLSPSQPFYLGGISRSSSFYLGKISPSSSFCAITEEAATLPPFEAGGVVVP